MNTTLVPFRIVQIELSVGACVQRIRDWLSGTRLKVNVFWIVGFYVFVL